MAPSVEVSEEAWNAIRHLGRQGEEDADVVARALEWVNIYVTLTETAGNTDLRLSLEELRKGAVVSQQLMRAGHSREMSSALCLALFGEQSEDDMKLAFRFFDRDGGGHVEQKELREALPLMGENVPEGKVDELFGLVDKDKSGALDQAEFGRLVRAMNPKDSQFNALQALSSGAGWAGTTLSNWTSGAASATSEISVAYSAGVATRNPIELRKAGHVATKMREAGYPEETANAIIRALFGEQSEEEMREAFKLFDGDKSGHISKDELRHAFPLMGEDLQPEHLEAVFHHIDADGTGEIGFEEFCSLVRRLNPREQPTDGAAEPGYIASAWGTMFGGVDSGSAGETSPSTT